MAGNTGFAIKPVENFLKTIATPFMPKNLVDVGASSFGWGWRTFDVSTKNPDLKLGMKEVFDELRSRLAVDKMCMNNVAKIEIEIRGLAEKFNEFNQYYREQVEGNSPALTCVEPVKIFGDALIRINATATERPIAPVVLEGFAPEGAQCPAGMKAEKTAYLSGQVEPNQLDLEAQVRAVIGKTRKLINAAGGSPENACDIRIYSTNVEKVKYRPYGDHIDAIFGNLPRTFVPVMALPGGAAFGISCNVENTISEKARKEIKEAVDSFHGKYMGMKNVVGSERTDWLAELQPAMKIMADQLRYIFMREAGKTTIPEDKIVIERGSGDMEQANQGTLWINFFDPRGKKVSIGRVGYRSWGADIGVSAINSDSQSMYLVIAAEAALKTWKRD